MIFQLNGEPDVSTQKTLCWSYTNQIGALEILGVMPKTSY